MINIQGFTVAILPIALSPGASFTLAMSNAAIVGHRGAFRVIAGTAIGILIHSVLVGLGVSGVLIHNHTAMLILKIIGVIFLMWLGVKRLLLGLRPAKEMSLNAKLVGVKDAFLLNILNAKAIIFYLTVVPIFAGKMFENYVVLSGIHIVIMAAWTYACCLLFSLAKDKFRVSTMEKVVNTLGGFVFDLYVVYSSVGFEQLTIE
ncbi:LysE family translocator [Vibrio sp. PP-XX7]